jgi:hypothetical protein
MAYAQNDSIKIGLIADTHGKLHPKIFDIFQNVDHIIHAGDIGEESILVELKSLADVTAVYGNMDGFLLRQKLNESELMELHDSRIQITHIPKNNHKKSRNEHFQYIYIHGHTHRPEIDHQDNRLIVNPGSASFPASGLIKSVGILLLHRHQKPEIEIINVD